MKRIALALAVIATLGLASCQREKDFNTTELGEHSVAFTLRGAPETRTAESTIRTISIPVKAEGSDETFILEETIEDLNTVYAPATKGTPAYTENVGTLYANKLGVHAVGGEFGDEIYESMDTEMVGGGWRYQHIYDSDPWPDETTPVDFYLYMPSDMASGSVTGVSGLSYAKTDNKQTISFNYISPRLASEQQDIIFAARSASKTDYMNSLPNGVPVLFNHALTGVKFRLGHLNDGKTITNISKVVFHGIVTKGSCVITPASEDNYRDNKTNYSSATASVWTVNPTDTSSFEQSFTNNPKSKENVVNYTSGSFGKSFYQAGNDRNLNDADASFTFWFIPQEMNENVVMEVYFTVYDGRENLAEGKTNVHEHVLKLNLGTEILSQKEEMQALSKTWSAGQLRTLTLKPLAVGVDIDDNVTKYTKKDVVVTNTGNVSEYVRVYIIANWMGKRQTAENVYNTDESVLMGYVSDEMKDGVYTSNDEVARWNDKDFTLNGETKVYPDWSSPNKTYKYTPYGEFVGLPPMGTTSAPGAMVDKWIRHDKFYYYTDPIGPGNQLPSTTPLFSSYTVGASPDFYIADNTGTRRKAKDVHLVMDIAVQAIEAPLDEQGNPTKTYLEAWTAALNPTNDPNFNINDL